MQALLKKLNDVVTVAEMRIKKADQERQVTAQLKVALDNQKIEQDKREEALVSREKGVTVYENIAVAQKEVEIDRQANKDERGRINEREAKLKEEYDEKLKRLEEDRLLLEQQKTKTRKEAMELAEEKKNYRQKILDEIDRKMGGK